VWRDSFLRAPYVRDRLCSDADAIAAGCDAFLDKPYAAADLVAVVAEHLPR